MKKAGPPWLRRSVVSGNARHTARTLESAPATSPGGNRLTMNILLVFGIRLQSGTDQVRLRSLLTMELLDSLVDDEALIRQAETPVAALVASHCELRNAYPNLLATLVVPDSRLTEITRQLPPRAGVSLSVITSAGAGGLLALIRHNPASVDIASVEPALRDLDDLAGSAARVISAAGGLEPEIAVF